MAIHSLKAYDYKVYVTGPFQAGKTTLIHSLDPYAISVERDLKEDYRGEKSSTTTGFDLGRIIWVRKTADTLGLVIPKKEYINEKDEYEGWITKEIELRGVPGQLHFKFVRDTMRMNSDGVLVVVDSSDPGMIGDASAILAETVASFGDIPLEVVANKQDRDDAVSPDVVATWLGVSDAKGMSARDRESCKDALTLLLRKIECIANPEDCCEYNLVGQRQHV
ncbi:MAG: ADP-ribosylation factor-like protein [Candidatus Thorarchaeota archaeon]